MSRPYWFRPDAVDGFKLMIFHCACSSIIQYGIQFKLLIIKQNYVMEKKSAEAAGVIEGVIAIERALEDGKIGQAEALLDTLA